MEWEEMRWRQRSRELWLQKGNKNTKYFQTFAKERRRTNKINKIVEKGKVLEGARAEEQVTRYYEDLFTKKPKWQPKWSSDSVEKLTVQDQDELVKPFEENELKMAIFSLGGKKHPDQMVSHHASFKASIR